MFDDKRIHRSMYVHICTPHYIKRYDTLLNLWIGIKFIYVILSGFQKSRNINAIYMEASCYKKHNHRSDRKIQLSLEYCISLKWQNWTLKPLNPFGREEKATLTKVHKYGRKELKYLPFNHWQNEWPLKMHFRREWEKVLQTLAHFVNNSNNVSITLTWTHCLVHTLMHNKC